MRRFDGAFHSLALSNGSFMSDVPCVLARVGSDDAAIDVLFVVDTGADRTMLNSETARQVLGTAYRHLLETPAKAGVSLIGLSGEPLAGAELELDLTILDEVEAPLTFRHPVVIPLVRAMSNHPVSSPLIGRDLLRDFGFHSIFPTGEVYLSCRTERPR